LGGSLWRGDIRSEDFCLPVNPVITGLDLDQAPADLQNAIGLVVVHKRPKFFFRKMMSIRNEKTINQSLTEPTENTEKRYFFIAAEGAAMKNHFSASRIYLFPSPQALNGYEKSALHRFS
jgi:hypothetical protein